MPSGVEVVTAGGLEDFQDAFGRWRGAVACLRVEGNLWGIGQAHPIAGFSSIRAQISSARNWQVNRASIRAGSRSRTGAACWTDLSRWCRRSRWGWYL